MARVHLVNLKLKNAAGDDKVASGQSDTNANIEQQRQYIWGGQYSLFYVRS